MTQTLVCRICGSAATDDSPVEWVDHAQDASKGFYVHSAPDTCHEALEPTPDGDYILLDGSRARLLLPAEGPDLEDDPGYPDALPIRGISDLDPE